MLADRLAWLLLAAIHAMPALALFRPALLTRLYGAVPGDSAYLLLQHRAALFLVVVIVAIWAALDPAVRRLSVVAVGVSMLSFLALYADAGRPSALRTIAVADLAGVVPLLFVAWGAWVR
ncbi:MAG: hypothetical protein ACOYLS_16365 [Polymorphobacter sp.]